MTLSKVLITTLGLLSFIQAATAAPNDVQSNVTPDILVGGLAVETGTHSGSVLNGKSTVYAKNARSYQSGLCTFKVNFSVYNDSTVKPGQFVTTMSYNNHPNVINSYTILNAAGIKTYEWLVHLKPGNNTIKVHADQQNNIHESNELNNRLTKRVKVIGQCSARNLSATPALNKGKTPIKPTAKQHKLQLPTAKLKDEANAVPQQAKQECKYDPNSARLPCMGGKRKPKMKLINPFE